MQTVLSQTLSNENTNASAYILHYLIVAVYIISNIYIDNYCRRLSELERESEDLRRKLRVSRSADPQPSPIALLTAAAEIAPRSETNSDSISATPSIPPPSYPPQLLAPNGLGISSSTPAPAPTPVSGIDGDTTRSRSLHGIEVFGDEIDDLFQLYEIIIIPPMISKALLADRQYHTAISVIILNFSPFLTHKRNQTHIIHNLLSCFGV